LKLKRETVAMAEELPAPIPKEYQVAFRGAIGLFRDWRRGQPGSEGSLYQKPIPISTLCDIVMTFEDPMPEDLWRLLLASAGVSDKLAKDRSYHC
jgi:hypothetical protein